MVIVPAMRRGGERLRSNRTSAADLWLIVALVALVGCSPPAAPLSASPNFAASPTVALPSPSVVPPTAALSSAALPNATPCVPTSYPPPPPPPRPKPQPEFNGRAIDPYPYSIGLVKVQIAVCRDAASLVAKYGLKGPATYATPPPFTDADRQFGLDRFFYLGVVPGTEPQEVERLAVHPEDFVSVTLPYIPIVSVVTTAPMPMPPNPAVGPPGSSFSMLLCCWPAGTAVTKTFSVPDGTSRTVPDVAGADGRVPAGWGGSPEDPRGLYVVTATGGGRADRLRFAIGGSCRVASQFVGDGDNAIFGHLPDRLEVTFCGGTELGPAEIARFLADYSLMRSSISQREGASVYVLQIQGSETSVSLVRRALADERVRSASVVPVVPGP